MKATLQAINPNGTRQFIEQHAVDRSKLQNLLERHELIPQWNEFERKFLESKHE